MTTDFDTDDAAEFRTRVRAWLDENAPAKDSPEDFSSVHIVNAATAEGYAEREHHAIEITREWQRRLFDAGLAGRSWPVEFGGHGGAQWQDDIVAEEQSNYGVSTKLLAVTLEMLPPVLFAHGTADQRARYLPEVLPGGTTWCQLLSEPDAGSDLGSVSTQAVAVDGGWRVSGQKVWTSGAGASSRALLIARTDRGAPGRRGLSCLAMDMNDPGVEVRPLRQMSGAYHFNEVFLADVFVAEDDLIGELGGAWPVLRTMLASERSAIGSGTSARSARQLRGLAARLGRSDEPVVRQMLAESHTRETLLDLTTARIRTSSAVAGPIGKLLYTEHARLSADAAMAILGALGTCDGEVSEAWLDRFLFAPGLRLGGGTDEIMRNQIGERGLGLPREPLPPSGPKS